MCALILSDEYMSELKEVVKESYALKKLLENKEKATPLGVTADFISKILPDEYLRGKMDLTMSNDGRILFLAPVLDRAMSGNIDYFNSAAKTLVDYMFFYSHPHKAQELDFAPMFKIARPKVVGINTGGKKPYTFAVYSPNFITKESYAIVKFDEPKDSSTEGTAIEFYRSITAIPEIQQLRVTGKKDFELDMQHEQLLDYLAY